MGPRKVQRQTARAADEKNSPAKVFVVNQYEDGCNIPAEIFIDKYVATDEEEAPRGE